jgi:hypothetical protein
VHADEPVFSSLGDVVERELWLGGDVLATELDRNIKLADILLEVYFCESYLEILTNSPSMITGKDDSVLVMRHVKRDLQVSSGFFVILQ